MCRRGEEPEHGKYSTYARGCRCDDCKVACAENSRSYRLRQKKVDRRECVICCERFVADFTNRSYCGDTCRDRAARRHTRRSNAMRKAATYARGFNGGSRRFIAGGCWCGKSVTKRASSGRYCRTHCVCCSDECHEFHLRVSRAKQGATRRARKRDAFVAPVSPLQVFIRDDWTCHLCGLPVDRLETHPHPLSPAVDHVIPLARDGTHEPDNCKTAHRICNSIKADSLHVDKERMRNHVQSVAA